LPEAFAADTRDVTLQRCSHSFAGRIHVHASINIATDERRACAHDLLRTFERRWKQAGNLRNIASHCADACINLVGRERNQACQVAPFPLRWSWLCNASGWSAYGKSSQYAMTPDSCANSTARRTSRWSTCPPAPSGTYRCTSWLLYVCSPAPLHTAPAVRSSASHPDGPIPQRFAPCTNRDRRNRGDKSRRGNRDAEIARRAIASPQHLRRAARQMVRHPSATPFGFDARATTTPYLRADLPKKRSGQSPIRLRA